MDISFKTLFQKALYAIMLLGIIFSSFGSGLPMTAHAQEESTGRLAGTPVPPGQPPQPNDPPVGSGAVQDNTGLWYIPEGVTLGPRVGGGGRQATGGPD